MPNRLAGGTVTALRGRAGSSQRFQKPASQISAHGERHAYGLRADSQGRPASHPDSRGALHCHRSLSHLTVTFIAISYRPPPGHRRSKIRGRASRAWALIIAAPAVRAVQ